MNECRQLKESCQLTYKVLADSNETVWNQFTVTDYPQTTILDCSMTVRYTAANLNESQVRNQANLQLLDIVAGTHTSRHDTENTTDPIPVVVTLEPHRPLTPGFPLLLWRESGGTFTEVSMTETQRNDYQAEIPAQPENTDVEYYIRIENSVGCNRNLPMKAPESLYHFHVGVDVVPPEIQHSNHAVVSEQALPVQIEADISDNVGIYSATLEYRINEGTLQTIAMTERNSYSAIVPDDLQVNDLLEYRIIAVDSAAAHNQSILPEQGFFSTRIALKIPVLIIDMDGSHNSGPVITEKIESLGVYCENDSRVTNSLSFYQAVFVCLGVYGSGNHELTAEEGNRLAAYLDQGGNLYMEGGDTWAYDSPTSVHSRFQINGLDDGQGDAQQILGLSGTFAQGMSFVYESADEFNRWIDRISAKAGADNLLKNNAPEYFCVVANHTATYNTIGSSIKFGGLIETGGGTTQIELIRQMLAFFNVNTTPVTPTPTGGIPTNTPIPTATPTMTATPVPSFTPVPPTSTAAPTTVTPTPPPECDRTGVTIRMPSDYFRPGDVFECKIVACSAGHETMTGIPLFVVLDVHGTYFFAPSFTEFDHYSITLTSGKNEVSVVEAFTWPDTAGEAAGINWIAAMTDRGITELFGEMDVLTFGWGN